MERLKAMAGPTVTFRGRVDDDALPSLYANAKAILFPTHEDAGLVPVEAQACGTPVVAFGRGGALDTVVKGSTGVFFETQSPEFLRVAIDTLDSSDWSPESIRSHAEQFSSLHFRERIAATVNAEYDRLHAERSAIAQR
jgi:glycosyltransferase involved in cell wall biosynthesis